MATTKKTTAVDASPQERFLAKESNIRAHHDMVDGAAFENGSDAALASYATDIGSNITDMNSAASAGYRLKGAIEFLQRFKTLAELPKTEKHKTFPSQLIPTDQPRRV